MAWSEVEANKGLAALGGCDLVEQPVESPPPRSHALPLASPFQSWLINLCGTGNGLARCARARDAADVFAAVKIAPIGRSLPTGKVAAIADAASIGLYGGTMLEGAENGFDSQRPPLFNPNLTWDLSGRFF